MSRPSGFVPIPFHLTGKMLLAIGAAGLTFYGLSSVLQWFSLPVLVPIASVALIAIGLYLIFVVPREDDGIG
jgi:hypothetical protein